jgi:putative iron-only hydrogenase system regulator
MSERPDCKAAFLSGKVCSADRACRNNNVKQLFRQTAGIENPRSSCRKSFCFPAGPGNGLMPAEERAGLRRKAGKEMEDTKRLGIVGIVVSDLASADQVNEVIHDHNDIVVARMGIPYKERNVSVISLLIDGEQDAINALTGELGKIKDVSAKAMLNKMK